jgi:hypothetical protein
VKPIKYAVAVTVGPAEPAIPVDLPAAPPAPPAPLAPPVGGRPTLPPFVAGGIDDGVSAEQALRTSIVATTNPKRWAKLMTLPPPK